MQPHEMTLAQFCKQASPVQLTNHGRKWDVKLGNYSAFSDAPTAGEACADVHHGAVNNALYLNMQDAPDLGEKPTIPSAGVMADYPDLAREYAEVLASKYQAAVIPMNELYQLWDQLGDVPTTFEGDDVDCIEQPFLQFEVGTHREEIWRWFEEKNPQFLVGEVMTGVRLSDAADSVPASLPKLLVTPGDHNAVALIAQAVASCPQHNFSEAEAKAKAERLIELMLSAVDELEPGQAAVVMVDMPLHFRQAGEGVTGIVYSMGPDDRGNEHQTNAIEYLVESSESFPNHVQELTEALEAWHENPEIVQWQKQSHGLRMR